MAGKQPGFGYSAGLKASKLTWTAAKLDQWLTDSNAMIPGSLMPYRQADPAKRAAIISYLATVPAK